MKHSKDIEVEWALEQLSDERKADLARWVLRCGLGQLYMHHRIGDGLTKREADILTTIEFDYRNDPHHYDVYETLTRFRCLKESD